MHQDMCTVAIVKTDSLVILLSIEMKKYYDMFSHLTAIIHSSESIAEQRFVFKCAN